MSLFHLTKTLSGGGGVYTSRLSDALRRSGVESRVLSLDDGSLVPPAGLAGKINTRFDWALSGMIHRRSRGTVLSFHRRQIWNPEVEIQADDIVHLHSITGFIGDRGLRHLLRNRPRVFWTAHNPWLFTGGCVAYAGCERFESGCKRCPLLKFPLERWTRGELKAKVNFWRDFGVKPIANSEWMAAMMRRSQLFEGMDIPVVLPIVDDVFTAKTEKLKADLTTEDTESTIKHRGRCEMEQPQVGPKGEGEGSTESKEAAGLCLDKPSGASESDSLASELADAPVSESLIRSADGPALARLAPGGLGSEGGNKLAESAEFLEDQSQAGLQMDNQKNRAIRLANDPSASGENSSSVSISVISGKRNSIAPEVLTPTTSYSSPVTAPKAQALVAGRSTLDSPMPRWAGGSRFVVGMSARSLTDRGKGIEEFFQRLPMDRAFLKETTFVLIGDGKIRVPAGLDCRFPGHVDSPERLAEMYRSLDLFVSASAMETFGMAILEAQACGTPVVAFETGGTPEAVCPSDSKLVRNGDWAGLFREVEKMFEHTVKGGGKKHELSDWVVLRHSWQAIAENQIAIYGML